MHKPPSDRNFSHPNYGPMCLLDDLPRAGPVFLSREGYAAWTKAGRPKIEAPIPPEPPSPSAPDDSAR